MIYNYISSNFTLGRFLKARNFDGGNAQHICADMLRWMKDFGVSTMIEVLHGLWQKYLLHFVVNV